MFRLLAIFLLLIGGVNAQVCFSSDATKCPKTFNPSITNGWVTLSDLAHQTQVSALLVTDGVTTTIPIDTSGTQTVQTYKYQLNPAIWNPAINAFCPDHEGDLYLFNLRFTAAKTGAGTTSLGVMLQVSGSGVIQQDDFNMVKGANVPQNFSITWMQNAGATFVSNCANFRVVPNGSNVNIWNPRVQFTEVYRTN